MVAMLKRQSFSGDSDYDCDDNGNCYSTWNSWGRWVALVVIIASFVLLAFVLSCLRTRRRRRLGMQPMRGMGWMAKPPQYGQHYYPNSPYGAAQPPPPMYSPPGVVPQQTGSTFNTNDGYYGHHQYQQGTGGIELQQPASAYQRPGDNVYEPPTGPPPGKKGNDIVA